MDKIKVIIMGAAGRDFHNFNVYFRGNEKYEVVAFTAAQIPGIADRVYPPVLAGPGYSSGIPIYPEAELPEIIKRYSVDEVILAYSDLSYLDVMRRASIVLVAGADFKLMGPKSTMLAANVPVISVCAVRTGAGKSTVARKVCRLLKNKGFRTVIVRHPMPYGVLTRQIVQRFASLEDLDKCECTIEEREEYEPQIEECAVYAGVDYEKILREAEKEADIIIWDGGNNDLPFYKPTLHIVVADPHRPGQELNSYPGEANLRMADVVVVNKVDTAKPEDVRAVKENISRINSQALIIEAASPISVDDETLIRGKKVLVIEDGPTLTHGNMNYGAGFFAAKKFGAGEIVNPRQHAVGAIKQAYEKYQNLENVLPAIGYKRNQLKDLEKTIRSVDCDSIVMGTPADLRKFIDLAKPTVRVRYELQEISTPNLDKVLDKLLSNLQNRS